tara:strand:+ start:3656 stop:4054 length:399 start_codon:yes stop_codon:yes gene_type:complete
MNVFTFTGNLGRDAERRTLDSGTSVANFSVPAKAGFGERESTIWVKCTMWGKRAEGGLVDILTKGTPVCVSGELSMREWTNQSGEIKTSLELNVNDVTLMGKGQERDAGASEPAPTPQKAPADEGLDTEIPF